MFSLQKISRQQIKALTDEVKKYTTSVVNLEPQKDMSDISSVAVDQYDLILGDQLNCLVFGREHNNLTIFRSLKLLTPKQTMWIQIILAIIVILMILFVPLHGLLMILFGWFWLPFELFLTGYSLLLLMQLIFNYTDLKGRQLLHILRVLMLTYCGLASVFLLLYWSENVKLLTMIITIIMCVSILSLFLIKYSKLRQCID